MPRTSIIAGNDEQGFAVEIGRSWKEDAKRCDSLEEESWTSD